MISTPTEPDHDDFGGLHRDVAEVLDRRRALQWLAGISLAGLATACGISSPTASSSTEPTTDPTSTDRTSSTDDGTATTAEATTTETAATQATAGAETPDETQGPYPADGSNGPNVLTEAGIVRSDLSTSFGSASGTADGIPVTYQLTIVDADSGSALSGAALYLWHCTADGRYSIYEVADQNYLRGVQATDEAGRVTFTSVFPGCYAGRWPHCHFEVYSDLDEATAGSQAVKTSQLALPETDCEVVYTDGRYGDSSSNLDELSLATDNVFSDGWTEQLATVSGSPDDGYTVALLIRV